MKVIYVDVNSKPKRIIVEYTENQDPQYEVFTNLTIDGPSELICGKRKGFNGAEASVWIETNAGVTGTLAVNQTVKISSK